MTHILLVSPERKIFKDLEPALVQDKFSIDWTDTGEKALSKFGEEKFDLFITHEVLPDMTGRNLVEKALFVNAMMNSVVLSPLSHDDFHDTYEGFGVLMQFPPVPGKKNAQALLEHLNRIAGIAGKLGSRKKGEQP
jgi:PleD family two-component response regulator